MTSDEHERDLFAQAFRPPGAEPYDVGQPFDADRLLDGFTEEQRTVRAADDPVLGEMAATAQRAWDAFLAEQ